MMLRRQANVSHEWIDQRSLAMETEIAQLIREKPELLDIAKTNLQRWIQKEKPAVSAALLEWDSILNDSTLEEVLNFLIRDDEDARRLRQSSPFCGILPEERRLAIFQEFETRLCLAGTTKSTSRNSPEPLIAEAEYQRALRESFGEEWAAISQLPEADRIIAMARIDVIQGEFPRDRAWPTEGGNEPLPTEGWDPSGTYQPAVVSQVYEELVRAGKIKMRSTAQAASGNGQTDPDQP